MTATPSALIPGLDPLANGGEMAEAAVFLRDLVSSQLSMPLSDVFAALRVRATRAGIEWAVKSVSEVGGYRVWAENHLKAALAAHDAAVEAQKVVPDA